MMRPSATGKPCGRPLLIELRLRTQPRWAFRGTDGGFPPQSGSELAHDTPISRLRGQRSADQLLAAAREDVTVGVGRSRPDELSPPERERRLQHLDTANLLVTP